MTLTEKYNTKECVAWKDNRKQVVLNDPKGGRSTYRGENLNGNSLVLFRIDGGVMKDCAKKQCDFALLNEDANAIRFIELKGSDCKQAIRQIAETMDYVLDTTVACPNIVYGRIVLSRARTPDIKTTELIKLSKKLKARNGDLKIQSVEMKERI